jgi:uncharacterized membrane protein
MKKFKAIFYEGLVFWVPAILTVLVFYEIFNILYGFIAAGAAVILPSFYKDYPWIKKIFEAGIIALTFLSILITGMIAETGIGRFFRRRANSLLRIIPFVNFFYDICRQIFDILFMKSENLLAHPVLVPFPHEGKLAIGFMTGKAEDEMGIEEHMKVYIPTVPFPTTGFLMVFPKSKIIEGSLTAEEALRLILTGGILDETSNETLKAQRRRGPKKPIGWLKTHFIKGMLLIFPAVIAAYITIRIFRYIYTLMKFSIALIPPRFGHLPYIDEITPVVTFIVLIFGTWFLGLIVKTYIGKLLQGHAYSLISYIPFVGALFHAFRQLMNVAFSDSPKTFSRVVLVDFPSHGSKAIGFITGDASKKLTEFSPRADEEQFKVFIPGTPNVASGFLVVVPAHDVTMTELSVQDGLLRVVSGGLINQTAGLGKQKPEPTPSP